MPRSVALSAVDLSAPLLGFLRKREALVGALCVDRSMRVIDPGGTLSEQGIVASEPLQDAIGAALHSALAPIIDRAFQNHFGEAVVRVAIEPDPSQLTIWA